jgi:hypothetical protein
VSVNLGASIPLFELNTLSVPFNHSENQFLNRHGGLLSLELLEFEIKLLIQEFVAFLSHLAVIFDGLQKEPRGISAIESGVISTIMEIGHQSVSHDLGEKQDGISGFLLESSCYE